MVLFDGPVEVRAGVILVLVFVDGTGVRILFDLIKIRYYPRALKAVTGPGAVLSLSHFLHYP